MDSHKHVFQLPRDGRPYFEEIFQRCGDLIRYGVWGGLDISQLRRWITNFTTDEEKYFAACVLDSLIYRSKGQTIALIRQLFQRMLPDLTRLNPTPFGSIDDWVENLRSRSFSNDPGVRLVAAVTKDDPPTKSAHIIARLMKQNLSICESWIIKPWEIQETIRAGIKIYVFIDDFLGTGNQFEDLFIRENLEPALANVYAVYAPLVAHESGQMHLQKTFPSLRINSVETLDAKYGLFHQNSGCFNDGVNTPNVARDFYKNLLITKKINVTPPYIWGYGKLELAYAFEDATPDNSLPILWWRKSPSWTPLFHHR